MTNRSIYELALRLVSEVAGENTNADYQERSVYLLPMICTRFSALDRAYRTATDSAPQELPIEPICSLEDDFPLSDLFLASAGALLGSLLVIEENPELSDRLNTLSNVSLEAIQKALPYRSERIQNKYS